MKVLIVDDIKENIYMLKSLFQGYGYNVETAADGVEALEKASREDFDIIVSDILMPRMDGFQLCREVKKDEKLKKIAFVFYTATYTEPSDEEFALSLGAERFIVKPIDPDDFMKIMEDVVKSYEMGKLAATKTAIEDETIYLKEYNERLIKKLEDKMLDLEKMNKILKESEEKYRNLIDNANDIVIVFDRNGCINFVNPQFYRLTGYTADEAKGMHLNKLIHPDDLKMVISCFNKRLAGKKVPKNYEARIMSKAGETIYIDNSASAIKKDDQITGVLMIMRDISKRKRAEEEIRMLAHTFKSINDCVNISDMDNNIISVNRAFCDVYGYKKEEIIGKNTSVLWSPLTPKEVTSEILPQTLKGGWQGELYNRRKDGSDFPIYLSTSVIRDENGKPIAMVGVSREITEQKLVQEEKEKLQAQLLHAQKMEAIGTLAGGVAHDFNNLLTVIQGHTELTMMDLSEDDPIYHDMKEVYRASVRAANLTRQLLLFSRQQSMELIPLNINEIIDNLLKMLQRLIGENIAIKTYLQTDLWAVRADAGNIEQVVTNIAVNARDAMPEGGEITILTENIHLDEDDCRNIIDARPGNFVRLVIEDTGNGMDEETAKRIFEPFFSTKGPGKGTGLGLSVVYGIIKQHNGWINVYSEPGQGSIFKIYLPAVQIKADKIDDSEISLKSLERYKGKGERILFVEDEAKIRNLAEKTLRTNGYIVFTATSAEEALNLFEQEQENFNLVFSDIVLPRQTGLHLIEQLLSRKPDLLVILSSGYSNQKSLRQSIQEKGIRFLQKPYSLSNFLRTIREVLDSRQSKSQKLRI